MEQFIRALNESADRCIFPDRSTQIRDRSIVGEVGHLQPSTGADRLGTREGRVPPLFSVEGQHRNCPPIFQFRKIAGHIA